MGLLKEINESYSLKEGNQQVLKRVLDYVMNPSHVLDGAIVGSAVDPEHALYQMQAIKEGFYKTEGRQLRHFVLSFGREDHIFLKDVFYLNWYISRFFGCAYQTISVVHRNTQYPHIHTIVNTVSYRDGSMYSGGYWVLSKLKKMINNYYPNLEIGIAINS